MWRLQPAYDLTPTPAVSIYVRSPTVTVVKHGLAAAGAYLASQANAFDSSDAEVRTLITDMRAPLEASWYTVCREAGVSEDDCEFIASAFHHGSLVGAWIPYATHAGSAHRRWSRGKLKLMRLGYVTVKW